MRLHNIPGAKEAIDESPLVIHTPEEYKGQWKGMLFPKENPLYLEIGCGKGMFLSALSEAHPEISYLGIEKFSSVIFRAVQKREQMEVSNLFYIRFDAEKITDIFGEGEVDKLYLNFSDPWPKDRHHKRRLTSREFLKRYEQILAPDAVVEFKTDNTDLFDFSLEEAEASGWEILACTRDLHKDPVLSEGNVMTEYEERFSLLGNRICKLIMRPGKKG